MPKASSRGLACPAAPGPAREFFPGGTHLRLGLEEIDRQHEQIRRLLNRLHAACVTADPAAWRPVFEQLGAAVKKHFRFEERLMRRYGDPALAGHKARHESLLERAADLSAAVRRGTVIDEPVLLYLKGWLRDHVLGPDARMAAFLRRASRKELDTWR